MTATIQPGEFFDLPEQTVPKKLIDVRSVVEFEQVHAVGAVNFPLDTFDPADVARELQLAREDVFYVICKMGGRSQKACNQFQAAGFPNVTNVVGGTDGWVAAKLPVVRGSGKAIAVNRQVQIVAGGLVLIGTLLSLYFSAAIWLAVAIGVGLVFSGVTDTCAMGTALAKMPWNQAKPKTAPIAKVNHQVKKQSDHRLNSAVSATTPASSADTSSSLGHKPELKVATTAGANDPAAACDSGG